ncbi:hypothetical protein BVY00_01695, partial [bacterium G20]
MYEDDPFKTIVDTRPETGSKRREVSSLRKIAGTVLNRLRPSAPETRGFHKAKRVKKVYNAATALRGIGALEKPDQHVIQLIKLEQPNVDYLSITTNPQFADVLAEAEKDRFKTVLHEPGYEQAVRVHLDARLKEDFPDKKVILRGVQVALNGSIKKGDYTIMDVVDVARLGIEKNHDSGVLIAEETRDPSDPMRVIGFVSGYAHLKNLRRREQFKRTGRADEIFPAVVVYDPQRLVETSRTQQGFEYSFAGDPEEAVLAIYILDAPLPTA